MSRPWMPLYIADYLADTPHLDCAESGAYMHLIMAYWQRGELPNDDRKLASIARASLEQWAGMRETLREFFEPPWRHKRIDEELEKSTKAYEKRALAGKIGGQSKASNAKAMPEQCSSNVVAITSLTHKKVKEVKKLNTMSVSEEKPTPLVIEKTKKKRQAYSAEFEEFWSGYPTDANMSKKQAADAWARMPPDARTAAAEALPAFRGYCAANPTYRPVHANRYLTQQRYDGHLQTARKVAARAGIFIRRGTPQWESWCEDWRRTGKGREPPSHNGGWHFPSEWPPKPKQTVTGVADAKNTQ